MIVHSDWLLTPQRVAVHVPTRTAVVADLHLGYDQARQRRGEAVPLTGLDDLLHALAVVVPRAGVRRLVIAGDLFEDAAGRALRPGPVALVDGATVGTHRDCTGQSRSRAREGGAISAASSGWRSPRRLAGGPRRRLAAGWPFDLWTFPPLFALEQPYYRSLLSDRRRADCAARLFTGCRRRQRPWSEALARLSLYRRRRRRSARFRRRGQRSRFAAARRAMRAATYPPLKPASILTTTTFAGQALSIVNSAAMPPNDAP